MQFTLHLRSGEAKLYAASTNSNAPISGLSSVPPKYHDFADVFSKAKSTQLPPHCDFDLKIDLEDGSSPPLGTIYSLSLSSTYNLCLASGCYSNEKEDKSYGGGVQHLKKRKEDVGGEGVSFSLCAAPLDRLSPRISEEWSYDRGAGVGVMSELIGDMSELVGDVSEQIGDVSELAWM